MAAKTLLLWAPLALVAAAALALRAAHRRDARRAADLARGLALESARPPEGAGFDPAILAGLPEPARRYLAAAVAAGARPARSVRLEMTGRFRLGAAWRPLAATERLAAGGLAWRATVTAGALPISVYDTLGPDGAAMRAWGLGLVPVARADGPEVTRSAAGRLAAELIWLPSALLPGAGAGATWEAVDADTARFRITLAGTPVAVDMRVNAAGLPVGIAMRRWGDPEGRGRFGEVPFGAELSGHRTFDGHTIPTRVRVGWGTGADFSPFMEAEVTAADFSGAP